MERLPEVETAKALMTEAMAWSVMKWLREKKRVRRTADQANAALDRLSEAVKAHWTDGVSAAYQVLVSHNGGSKSGRNIPKEPINSINPEIVLIAKKIKEADDEAESARLAAEDTFDEAEKRLSTSLAREGCRKAIHAWNLREKAIRKAEAVNRSKYDNSGK